MIATASAMPVYSSQRGSAVMAAAAAPRTASASILAPSSQSTDAYSRCAGPGAEVTVSATPRPNCRAEMIAAARPETSANRRADRRPPRAGPRPGPGRPR